MNVKKYLFLLTMMLGIGIIEVYGSHNDNALFLELKIDDKKTYKGQLNRVINKDSTENILSYYAPWFNVWDNLLQNNIISNDVNSSNKANEFVIPVYFTENILIGPACTHPKCRPNVEVYKEFLKKLLVSLSSSDKGGLIQSVEIHLPSNYTYEQNWFAITTPIEEIINNCSEIIITTVGDAKYNNFSIITTMTKQTHIINFEEKTITTQTKLFTPTESTLEAFTAQNKQKFTPNHLTQEAFTTLKNLLKLPISPHVILHSSLSSLAVQPCTTPKLHQRI